MYEVQYDVKRIGWCVFKQNNDGMTVKFHAGPFTEKAVAESEAKRLNDLSPNAKVTGSPVLSASLCRLPGSAAEQEDANGS